MTQVGWGMDGLSITQAVMHRYSIKTGGLHFFITFISSNLYFASIV